MFVRLLPCVLLLGISVFGQKPDVPTRPNAPEVAMTVAMMSGTWIGKMTAIVPGYPAETFDWKMVCRTVADGAGVSCTNSGKASIGTMSESCLLAFDPEGKAVHYMCVTSMGEVHDHKGAWINPKTIDFEPLRASFTGRPIVETLKWQFPEVDTIHKTSEIKLANGETMNFEFRGKRTRNLLPVK